MYFFVQPGDSDPNDTSPAAYDGLVGQDLFQKLDIDLDFGANALNLISQDHCAGKVTYWSAPAIAIIPFSIDRGGHIILRVELDGKNLNSWLDTGATATNLNLNVARQKFSVDVNAPDVEKIGELNGSYTANIYRRRFRKLAFGGVSVSDPSINLLPDLITQGPQAPRTGSLIKGDREGLPDLIIGMSVLSKLHVYIANGEHKLYISAATPPATPSTAP